MSNLHDQWIIAMELPNEQRLAEMKRLLTHLPIYHLDVVKLLIPFLCKILTYEEKNRMGLAALATVISPNLLWPAKNVAINVKTMKCINEVGKALMVNW